MKIAFFVSRFPVRSETFILQQMGGLLDRGHEVEIYAGQIHRDVELHADFSKYRLVERTRVYRHVAPMPLARKVAKRARRVLANLFRHPVILLRALNVFRYGGRAASLDIADMALCLSERPAYDIVHCHFGPVGEDAAILKELGALRGKLVTTFHSYDILRGIKTGARCYRHLIRGADAIHSISDYNRKWLEHFGFPTSRIHYHPMGIEVSRFPLSMRNGHPGADVQILTVARLAPAKGLAFALQALADIRKERPELRWCYRVIGGGPLAAALRAKVEELGLQDVVEFSGFQDQAVVRAALGAADLFVLSSVAEALPVALMEAMASGLAVVATDVGGIAELIRDGETGRLVPPGNTNALREVLEEMLADPRERRRYGVAARELVVRRHDTSVLCDRLVQHYRTLVASDARGRKQAAVAGSA